MSRLAALFAGRKEPALIAFITVGYPDLAATLEAVPLLESCGVDAVELGIPFSDPLVDGITIQQASYRALQKGITPAACLEAACLIRQKSALPLLFMSYYNPILSYGPALFCREAARAGVDGLIIPDLPLEEAGVLEASSLRHNLDLVGLLAPNSPPERIGLVAGRSRGFIYLVSLTGVTGMRQELPPGVADFVARVRSLSSLPLCLGFGISTKEQAAQLSGHVEGVIVGSSIVQLMGSGEKWQPAVARFVRGLKEALVQGRQAGP